MGKLGIISLALVIALSGFKIHKNNTGDDISKIRGYKNWYIDNFRCGVFVPPSYDKNKKYPLIIILHGYSDTTSWNYIWYKEPILSEDPCIVLSPKCPVEEKAGWGSSFKKELSPMMVKTFEMIKLVEGAFNLDKDRYYIHGTSMGGHGTYGVLQKFPDMFAAAYAECGSPNIEIAPIIAKIPIWIFHGSNDPVVPVQPNRNLYKAVLALGGTQIRYTEYQGAGHDTWNYTVHEATLQKWLLAQRKGSSHQPPENVKNFEGSFNSSSKHVELKWVLPDEKMAKNDDKIWFCKIYRNNSLIAEVYNDKNTYTDTILKKGASYHYNISAVNYYFKESGKSQKITIKALK